MISMVKATTPVQLISVGRLTSRPASASLRSLERQRGAGDRCGRKDEVVEEHLYTTKSSDSSRPRNGIDHTSCSIQSNSTRAASAQMA